MTIKQHARQRGYFLCTPVMACFTDESGWDMGLADAVLTTRVRLFVDEQRWKKKKEYVNGGPVQTEKMAWKPMLGISFHWIPQALRGLWGDNVMLASQISAMFSGLIVNQWWSSWLIGPSANFSETKCRALSPTIHFPEDQQSSARNLKAFWRLACPFKRKSWN